MIFSDLFQSAYKSKDPQKRLSSIDKLDPSKEKDKAALHELAFNDEDDSVSIKALNKLDSFILWMKALETIQSAKVKKIAMTTCISQLESKDKVSDDLYASFIKESKNKPLLEQLIFSSQRLQNNNDLILDVLKMLGNENNIRRFFQEFASKEQQLLLIESENDAKTLSRWSKLTQHQEALELINRKLEKIELAKQKPIKVKQKATLINSRLLALKDAVDYEYLQAQFSDLVDEFEALKHEFKYLDDVSASSFSEKYLSLKTSLQQKLSELEADHQHHLLLKQTTTILSELNERCKDVEQQINLLVAHSQDSEQAGNELSIDPQVKILANSLESITSELNSIEDTHTTVSHHKAIDKLIKNVRYLQAKLDNIPNMISAAGKLNELIEKQQAFIERITHNIEQVDAIETSYFPAIEEHLAMDKRSFNELKSEYNNLMPVNLVKQHASGNQKLYKIQREIKQELKQKERKVDSKLKVINNLVNQGKYRPAISMFHNLEDTYNKVADTASVRLQKSYQNTSEEISKLRDWQAYIAQPRKPELVEQAQRLMNTASNDLYERAEQIKSLRQQYSSLGNLHTPEDTELNEKFNQYIEEAFSPCRAFFADLEKQRAENYKKALMVIEQVENAQVDLPHSDLIKTVNQFKTQFNQVGDVDKKHKNRIKRDFNKALKPLNKAINDAVEENARLKEKLVNEVESICSSMEDDSFDILDAVDQAKEIQLKWKKIGFAGKPKDNELWQEFRALNDKLFNRYHESQTKKQTEINAQLNLITDQTQRYKKQINEADTLSSLSFYDDSRKDLMEKVEPLDSKNTKLALNLIGSMDDEYAHAVNRIHHQKEQQETKDLFLFLDNYHTEVDAKDALLEPLSSKHKSWITSYDNKEAVLEGLDRLELAQAATILFDKQYSDLPIGDESSRKNIQLKIMASKLEGGGSISTESILAAWISHGPIDEQDKTSFEVMKTLYLKQ